MKDVLLMIVGPTAVGKTTAAVAVAQMLGADIISADSRQFYRELRIGTAKPTPEEFRAVPHHFIDCKSVTEPYDAASYGEDARRTLRGLFEKSRYAIVCGGSGLYIKGILEGFDDMPASASVREEIRAEYAAHGIEWLQRRLKEEDAAYYAEVDRQNPHRLMRALEIVRAGGKPVQAWHNVRPRARSFAVVKVGLTLPKEELHARINARVDEMIAAGLFEEAQSLLSYRHLQALQTVGYREAFGYLVGDYDQEEAIRLMKLRTRQYAKRQLTWFKRDKETVWFHPQQNEEICHLALSYG